MNLPASQKCARIEYLIPPPVSRPPSLILLIWGMVCVQYHYDTGAQVHVNYDPQAIMWAPRE